MDERAAQVLERNVTTEHVRVALGQLDDVAALAAQQGESRLAYRLPHALSRRCGRDPSADLEQGGEAVDQRQRLLARNVATAIDGTEDVFEDLFPRHQFGGCARPAEADADLSPRPTGQRVLVAGALAGGDRKAAVEGDP